MSKPTKECGAPSRCYEFGCNLPKGHKGVHQNFGAAPREKWVQGAKIGVRWRSKK